MRTMIKTIYQQEDGTYIGDLGTDSVYYIDGRFGRSRAIEDGKRYIDSIIKIHPYLCGFILYHRGTETRHIYSK